MMRAAILAAGLLPFLLGASPALADDCTPRLITALDMIDEPDGRVAVTVNLAGAPQRLLLATSNAHSELFQAAVTAAGFRQTNLPDNKHFSYFGGNAVGYANVDSLSLGTARGGAIQVLVTPGPYDADSQVAGTLAADLLGNFDVELNFETHRVNLFASNPCDGKEVYWASQYSQLALSDDGLTVPATLDGKEVRTELDTLAPAMSLHFNTAKALFGLDTTSPSVTQVGGRGGNALYRYPFNQLVAGQNHINHPAIVLTGSPDAPACDGKAHTRLGAMPGDLVEVTCRNGGELTMGVRQLRRLHLYFAYKTRKVYFTLADAH